MENIEKKNIIISQEVNPLIYNRWSPRVFDPKKKITHEQILSLAEAARLAPSCFGDEPWRFIFFNKDNDAESYDKAFHCLGEWNQRWVKNCPLIIICLHDTAFRKNDNKNKWGSYDTGAAAQNLCLQATDLGLMAHQMGGFSVENVINTFEIPDRYNPISMIAVGYKSTNLSLVDEEFQKTEIEPRKRRALDENFFSNSWGNPLSG